MGVVVTQACPGPVATEFEKVAGNFTGVDPGPLQITARRCARAVVRGFARGKAMVIPGVLVKVLLALGAITPRWLLRVIYGLGAGWFRRRQHKAQQLG